MKMIKRSNFQPFFMHVIRQQAIINYKFITFVLLIVLIKFCLCKCEMFIFVEITSMQSIIYIHTSISSFFSHDFQTFAWLLSIVTSATYIFLFFRNLFPNPRIYSIFYNHFHTPLNHFEVSPFTCSTMLSKKVLSS